MTWSEATKNIDLAEYEGAACGLLVTSADGAIRRVNETFCAWIGRSAAELQGKRFHDLLADGGRSLQQAEGGPWPSMQTALAEVQLELVHGEGGTVPVVVNATWRRGPGGPGAAPDGAVDIAVFIALGRRQHERELSQARDRAEELLASEREAQQRAELAELLIGIVSHDLRNPLQAVSFGASALGAVDLGEHAAIVRRIAASAERANRLITDLLDFTQARLGGGLRITPRELDLHQVVADCLDEVTAAWPGRQLRHQRVGFGAGLVDPDRLAQVVSNLVNNALVYGTPEEPVTITSTVSGAELMLLVHNNGPPIPEPVRPQLFEPLRRGEREQRPGLRNVGLGLYIVREIARAHAGEVSVCSTLEGGTTFAVTLPRRTRHSFITQTAVADAADR